jgi:cell division protein FtsB
MDAQGSHTPEGGGEKRRAPALWRLRQVRVPWYAVAAAFCAIVLMGWVAAGSYDAGIDHLRGVITQAGDLVFQKEQEVLRLTAQVKLAQTDQFIAGEARNKYGYLFPGEIRFVVTNPEVLGLPPRDAPAATQAPPP